MEIRKVILEEINKMYVGKNINVDEIIGILKKHEKDICLDMKEIGIIQNYGNTTKINIDKDENTKNIISVSVLCENSNAFFTSHYELLNDIFIHRYADQLDSKQNNQTI